MRQRLVPVREGEYFVEVGKGEGGAREAGFRPTPDSQARSPGIPTVNCCINGAQGPTEYVPPRARLSWGDATDLVQCSPPRRGTEPGRWMTPQRLVELLGPTLNPRDRKRGRRRVLSGPGTTCGRAVDGALRDPPTDSRSSTFNRHHRCGPPAAMSPVSSHSCRGRPCSVPSPDQARTTTGCRGRACPVPCQNRARNPHGRGQPPPHGVPCQNGARNPHGQGQPPPPRRPVSKSPMNHHPPPTPR